MSGSAFGRAIGAVQAGTGVALLTRPGPVIRTVTRSDSTQGTSVARLLGGRLIVQGVALAAFPTRGPLLAAGVVDLLHATSMIAVAAVRPDHRRGAVASALFASMTGSLSIATARKMAPGLRS